MVAAENRFVLHLHGFRLRTPLYTARKAIKQSDGKAGEQNDTRQQGDNVK